MKLIKYHWELDVYKLAVEAAMKVFELTKTFLVEERYSLTDQVRRSSRSTSAQIAEAWRRRKYEGVFVNKLNESEGEAAETLGWLEYGVKCGYLSRSSAKELHNMYDLIIGKLVIMGNNPARWLMDKSKASPDSLTHFPTHSPTR
ncbi:MAG: ribosomal protein [Pedosphaera sp.]|nr:ribosomal protein [Pedosphaera sp.]